MGAHPGGLLHGRPPGRRLRRGLRLLGRGPRRDARATTTTTWIRRWVLDVETQEQWLEQLGPERVAALRAEGRSRLVARRRAGVPARSRRAGERVGARRGVGRAVPRRPSRRARAPTRCSPARASRTSPRGSACSSRATRVATCSSPRRSASGVTTRRPADPFVLNHRNFPTATMLGDAQMVLGALVGGAGRRRSAVSAARRSTASATSTRRGSIRARSSSDRAAATTSRAPRPRYVVVATLTPQRTPADCSYITSPGRAVRALVTDLGMLEKRRPR